MLLVFSVLLFCFRIMFNNGYKLQVSMHYMKKSRKRFWTLFRFRMNAIVISDYYYCYHVKECFSLVLMCYSCKQQNCYKTEYNNEKNRKRNNFISAFAVVFSVMYGKWESKMKFFFFTLSLSLSGGVYFSILWGILAFFFAYLSLFRQNGCVLRLQSHSDVKVGICWTPEHFFIEHFYRFFSSRHHCS